jgi:iron complex transport system substrate-binding protein
MRILSLLPAGTEIVCALGAADSLVGISHECDYPPNIMHLPRVTASLVSSDAPSSQIDADVRALMKAGRPVFVLDAGEIVRLKPDVIITQSLCDVCAVSDGVAHSLTNVLAPQPVIVLPLVGATLSGVWNDIQAVASIIGCRDMGRQLLSSLDTRIRLVHETLKAAQAPRPRVAVIEWLDPLFAAGHWTPELVRRAGGIDVLAEPGSHSQEITIERVKESSPDLIVFAPCGFNVERAAHDSRELLSQPEWHWASRVQSWAIDGNALTSRPGPRLADAIETLASIIAPASFDPASSRFARVLAPAVRH